MSDIHNATQANDVNQDAIEDMVSKEYDQVLPWFRNALANGLSPLRGGFDHVVSINKV